MSNEIELPVRKSNLFFKPDRVLFQFGAVLGDGSCGTVVQVTCNQCAIPLVAKLVVLEDDDDPGTNFQNEIEISERMGDAGIGPRIVASVILPRPELHSTVGILIMEQLDFTLSALKQNQYVAKDILDVLLVKLRQMLQLGYRHDDLSVENIMVRTNKQSQVSNVYMIDWGWTTSHSPSNSSFDFETNAIIQTLRLELQQINF